MARDRDHYARLRALVEELMNCAEHMNLKVAEIRFSDGFDLGGVSAGERFRYCMRASPTFADEVRSGAIDLRNRLQRDAELTFEDVVVGIKRR